MRRVRAGVLIALTVLAIAGAAFQRHNPLTAGAQDYARTIAQASAGVYITLRTLNAVLSTAQEVEVGGSVIVTGSLQPLKVLEPIDDTVERIAGAVFALMLATGILAVAMGPVGSVGWVMIAIAGVTWLVGGKRRLGGLGRRLLVYGAFLAVALPLAFLLSSAVAEKLTADVWNEHKAIIDEITGSVLVDPAEDPPSTVRKVWDSIDAYRALTENISTRADDLLSSYIALLSVFVFKLFVLPGLLAGGLFLAARSLARPPSAG